ncbi:MAG: IS66 family insertion sequence element accessory protein TnpB [Pseudomonadota bacterium]
MICAQTKLPGVSVSQVARRYDVNANHVFIWLRDERYQAEPEDIDVARLLPVEVVDAELETSVAPAQAAPELEVTLSNRQRLTVRGGFDPDAPAMLIRKLAS